MGKGIRKELAALAIIMLFTLAGNAGMAVVQAAGSTQMTIVACQINADLTSVTVTAQGTKLPGSDDGKLYLFAEPCYSGGITTAALGSQALGTSVTFTAPLDFDTASSKLYSKFVVATLQGGQYVPVSSFVYLTNPQIMAAHTGNRIVTTSKKGLIPDPARFNTGELADLGVQHITYNIPVADLLGPTTNGSYPTINYTYNGVNYQFNGLKIAEYDGVFKQMQTQNIEVTAVLLNNYNATYLTLIHPLSRDGTAANYYAFNATGPTGCGYLEAIGSFLAARYSGTSGKGQVDNWIVGNEVSARVQWNYIQSMSVEAYAEEYAKALRTFYIAIKSQNANARVFTCIDQVWDRNNKGDLAFRYDSKDFLTALNTNIKAQGNFSWGIACHPHPVPLTYAPFWSGTAYYKNLIRHSQTTPFMSMENIEVLTDFLCSPEMLTAFGNCRPIIVSEVGYTSTQGENNQAAALMYGYIQAKNNTYINAFIVNSQTDHPAEIAQGLSYGLQNTDGSHKMAYDFFKYMDTDNAQYYKDFARNTIGFADWKSVIQYR